ncbi:MAG: hypothetical protein GX599_02025, partial [Chloroflexi bacterium]|nr:hypothetical protein [Chloroflexota bacterium]
MAAKTTAQPHSKQPRLLILAIIFLFFQAAALSLADGTRLHLEYLKPDWMTFVPFL